MTVELDAWAAYLETGSMREAARRLGVHEVTVKKRIGVLRDLYGVRTNAQLAVAIERAGDATKVVAAGQ